MSTYEKIEIVPYNNVWEQWFIEIQSLLKDSLGQLAVSVEHIGSTSVPGLGAKNRIDVQVTVKDLSENTKHLLDEALLKNGFKKTEYSRDHVPAGDAASEDQWLKFFLPGKNNKISFDANIHIRKDGNANAKYAIIFRDYLKVHPNVAKTYQTLKEKLASLHPHDINAYVDIKDQACDLIIFSALEWLHHSK